MNDLQVLYDSSDDDITEAGGEDEAKQLTAVAEDVHAEDTAAAVASPDKVGMVLRTYFKYCYDILRINNDALQEKAAKGASPKKVGMVLRTYFKYCYDIVRINKYIVHFQIRWVWC